MMYMVTGAFSFTGRHVTRQLLQEGHQVRTITRVAQSANPFREHVEVALDRYDDVALLRQALSGCDRLINTYWRRQPDGRHGYDLAVQHSKNLFAAAEYAGVKRMVHVSINDPEGKDFPYFHAKCATEQAARESSMSTVIVRPQLVFGDGELLINNLAWSLRKSKIAPVPGDGRYLMQPIHAQDYGALIARLSRGDEVGVVDGVGPDVMTYDQLVRSVGGAIGRPPRIIHVHPRLFAQAARVMDRFFKEPTVLKYEVYGCLVNNGVVPRKPQGQRRLSDWLTERGTTLGQFYAHQDERPFLGLSGRE
jgi:NADH dehydrogenase